MHLNRDHSRKLSLLLTTGLILLASVWIGRGVFRLGYLQLDMDEALHARRGLDITSAVLRGDWQTAMHELTKPDWYPPGHGITLGIWLWGLGPNVETARLYSTLWFALLGLLLWFSLKELLPDANPFLYMVPALFLVADALYTVYAGLAMLELPAVTLAFAGIFFLLRAWRRASLTDHMLAFLFGGLSIFTKYNFGLITLAAYAVCWPLMWYSESHQSLPTRKRWMILGAWITGLMVLVIWFWGLDQWRWFVEYSTVQPAQYSLWSLANLLYYPRMIWNQSINWLAALLAVGGLILMLVQRRYLVRLTPYLVYFAASLLILIINLQNGLRFGMMLLPALWIMAGIGAHYLFGEQTHHWLRRVSIAALLGLLILASFSNLRSFMSQLFATHENANNGVELAYDYVANVLDIGKEPELDIVMQGRTDQWSGPALGFNLQVKCLSSRSDCNIKVLDTRELRRGWPEREFTEDVQQQRVQQALMQADYLVQFTEAATPIEDWVLISEREFVFERQGKKPATRIVAIYVHELGGSYLPNVGSQAGSRQAKKLTMVMCPYKIQPSCYVVTT